MADDWLFEEAAALDAMRVAADRLRRALDMNTPSPVFEGECHFHRAALAAAIRRWQEVVRREQAR